MRLDPAMMPPLNGRTPFASTAFESLVWRGEAGTAVFAAEAAASHVEMTRGHRRRRRHRRPQGHGAEVPAAAHGVGRHESAAVVHLRPMLEVPPAARPRNLRPPAFPTTPTTDLEPRPTFMLHPATLDMMPHRRMLFAAALHRALTAARPLIAHLGPILELRPARPLAHLSFLHPTPLDHAPLHVAAVEFRTLGPLLRW